jgi:cyclic pyranopterin phosphate synthase
VEFRQVDVSKKPVTRREAIARGRIRLKPGTLEVIRKGKVEKGDPLSLARLSGIAASKRVPEFILLCHQLRLESSEVTARLLDDGVEVTSRVVAHEKTGVEMEALTAAAVALLNVWDAVKQYEKDERGQYPHTCIEELRVVRKVKGDG